MPDELIRMDIEMMRRAGLSEAKCRYLKNVALFAQEQGLRFSQLNKMNNDEVIEYLTQIKGVGNWTAEMVLMFALGREDVFPATDGGIIAAMKKLYGLKTNDKQKLMDRMHQIAALWSPYRTYACMYLWKFKDS